MSTSSTTTTATAARIAPRGVRASDLALVMLVVAIVALLVIPMPIWLLDSLIATNIMLSVALLMLAAYVPSALSLSTFPTLLLFTTLLRLSLNIASTKNILLHSSAGHIIETFGRLVMGGNVVVGLVVFLIIAIVQFIVIAKGSERVAEVGARFSLDAMPGKQMSIDADLRAGNLTKEEARRRRSMLEKESQMHGAMDGAMKFVKGDAIAGLIIAAINIIGGIIVGMLLRGMDLAEAAARFVMLSIGDGMVSQVPSLFVSIAAGVLITRVGNPDNQQSDLSTEVTKQLLSQPIALMFTGLIMLLFILVPGFPRPVFLAIGVGLVGAFVMLRARQKKPSMVELTPMPAFASEWQAAVPLILGDENAGPTALVIEIPAAEVRRLDPIALDTAVMAARRRVRAALGVPFPGARLALSPTLAPQRVRLLVQEVPIGEFALVWGARLVVARSAIDDLTDPRRDAAYDRPSERATDLPAAQAWAVEAPFDAEQELRLGPEEVIAWAVQRALIGHADQFVGMQEVQQLLDESTGRYPGLVEEVTRTLPLQRIAEVMRRLVQERISIGNRREIFEALITWGSREKDVVMLTEYVRVDLGRQIAFRHARGRSVITALVLDSALEVMVRGAIQQSIGGQYLALTPDQTRGIGLAFDAAVELLPPAERTGLCAVCSMDVRRYVLKLLQQMARGVTVLSYQELASHVQVQSLAVVQLVEDRTLRSAA
jgi:type III secretion protein V